MGLSELCKELESCKKCTLFESRTNLVFGVGNEKARVMFVGEAPGFHEDIKGEPFVGAAGKLLDTLLGSIGLSRSNIYISNVLKCRPPNNRNPLPDEIEACKEHLFQQIKIINPDFIVTLGNFSTQLLLNTTEGISKLHGRAFKVKTKIIFPIYHPAAGLYTGAVKDVLFKDFKKLEVLLSAPPVLEPDLATKFKDSDETEKRLKNLETEQMSLW